MTDSGVTVSDATPDEVCAIEAGLEGAGDGINGTWQITGE